MLTIYTPMAGDLAEEAINSLAVLVAGGTFQSAISIAVTIGVCGFAYQYILQQKIEHFLRFFFICFSIFSVLIGIKVPVAIYDVQNPMIPHEVDDVPIGVALPAALISQIGYGVSHAVDDAFHMPKDLEYSKTGMIFGSRVALAAHSANFGLSPDLSDDLSNYLNRCVWVAKVQTSHQLSLTDIFHSPNLENELFSNPSPLYHVVLRQYSDKTGSQSGVNVSCVQAAVYLKGQLRNAQEKQLKRLANVFTDGDKVRMQNNLNNVQNFFLENSQAGASLLLQNMLINKVRDSVGDAMAFSGDQSSLMNYANSASMNHLRIAEANTFWMAGYRLPMLNACLWILMICLFPIVVLVCFFPGMDKAYVTYIKTMVWIWSWPPMFSILHFFVSFYDSHKTNLFGLVDGGLTLSNANSMAMIHSDMAFTAGFLAMSVPFLAKAIVTGLSGAFGQMAQYLGGMVHGVSQSIAGQASHGNISVANFSGWNANYDNLSAHKHDANYTDYRGMVSSQLSNGAIDTVAPNGQHIIQSSGAISSMAVGVQGSQALVASLSHNAQVAQNLGNSLRTAADHSLQSGFREGASFNQSDANDYRVGGGLSNTDQYGINADYREMQDAVNRWNESHDGSHQINMQEAMRASFNTNDQLFGKIGKWATGLSAGANANLSHDHSQVDRYSKFFESSQGKNFNQAFSHAVSTAASVHEDGSASHQLSKAEQSAVDLHHATSLNRQASDEFSKSQGYSQAAQMAESDSQSINTNLNNAFVNWAIRNKGVGASGVLSGTDAQSVKESSAWSQEFLNSSTGKSLLRSEASSLISQVQSSASQTGYQQGSSELGVKANISGAYQANKQSLMSGQASAVSPLNRRQMASAQEQYQRAMRQDMMKQAQVIQSTALGRSQAGMATMNQEITNRRGTVNNEFKHGVLVGDALEMANGFSIDEKE